MILSDSPRFLLDVNVLVALLEIDHIHHRIVTKWFNTPDLQWSLCCFTEAACLRHMARPKTGGVTMPEATAMLARLTQEPGYWYQSISADWQTLSGPFSNRLFGHNQITDAYLLGLAVENDLVLVTFDRGILHLAGVYGNHVLLLTER